MLINSRMIKLSTLLGPKERLAKIWRRPPKWWPSQSPKLCFGGLKTKRALRGTLVATTFSPVAGDADKSATIVVLGGVMVGFSKQLKKQTANDMVNPQYQQQAAQQKSIKRTSSKIFSVIIGHALKAEVTRLSNKLFGGLR
jgi:hypothetical protein